MSTRFASTGTSPLTGTSTLARLALRRDRVLIPVWTLVIAGFTIVTASSFDSLYPTAASRVPFARQIESNTGLIALTGQPFDLTTTGGLTAWRIGGFAAILASVMSLLLVVRHTRAEEEADRLELVRAQAVGVLAPLTAAVLTMAAANASVAVALVAGLTALGLPVAGSLALALAITGAGIVFGALGTAAAQLSRAARGANSIGSILIGLAYLLRAAGDSSGHTWISWVSPVGWAEQVRAFAQDRWWVLLLDLSVGALLLGIAYRLAATRDLGDGLLASRPGPVHAAAWLASPGALAWRLQRGTLLVWAVGFAVYGTVLGGLASSVTDLVNGSPQVADMLEALGGRQAVADAYLATMLSISGIMVAAYTVQSVLRLAGEESSQRAEPLLALPVRRTTWVLGHLVLSLAGTLVLMLALGACMGLAYGLSVSDPSAQVPRLAGAALAMVPAAWVLGAVTVLIYATVPRWSPIGWMTVLLAFFLAMVGPLAHLSHWVMDVSPYTHIPKLPGAPMTWTPLLWLIAITLVLCAAALAAFRRRDLT